MGWADDIKIEYTDTYKAARTHEGRLADAARTLLENVRFKGKTGVDLALAHVAPAEGQWSNVHEKKIAMDGKGVGRFAMTFPVNVAEAYDQTPNPVRLVVQVSMWEEAPGAWRARIESGEDMQASGDTDKFADALLGAFKEQIRQRALRA